jgi:pentatricopeptide repeat protein
MRGLLKSMKQAGCTLDLWTHNILLDTANKVGSISKAMQIFYEFKAAGLSPNLVSFSALINMYG